MKKQSTFQQDDCEPNDNACFPGTCFDTRCEVSIYDIIRNRATDCPS